MPVNVKVVSVVRDYEMYARCLSGNPCCRELTQVPLDNRTKNLPVPVLYNRFLDTCTEDCWIVFCHEDWQPVCDLRPVLEPLDKDCLYGPIGIYLETCDRADFLYIRGFVAQFRKDGRHHKTIHGVLADGPVDTFDCQCLMVHSSLVRRYGLRFDERLAFDLYVEDFCAAARERFDIESRSSPSRAGITLPAPSGSGSARRWPTCRKNTTVPASATPASWGTSIPSAGIRRNLCITCAAPG